MRNERTRSQLAKRIVLLLSFLTFFFTYLSSFVLRNFTACRKLKCLLVDDLVFLSPPQRTRYNRILSGRVTKADVEIVMSVYTEDIHWSDIYSNIRTAYFHHDNLSNPTGSRASGKVHIPNVGRESYVYLKHIVEFYDNLADLTIFTHGEAPTSGYAGHRKGGGHVPVGFTFHDYVLADPDVGLFLASSMARLPTMCHYLCHLARKNYIYTDARVCPSISCAAHMKFEFPDWLQNHIISLCRAQNATACAPNLFWDEYIRVPRPKDDVIFFAQGARLAIPKRFILRRPKYEYQRLLQLVAPHRDPWAGFFLEWFWFPLLTSSNPPCASNIAWFDWAKTSIKLSIQRGIDISGDWSQNLSGSDPSRLFSRKLASLHEAARNSSAIGRQRAVTGGVARSISWQTCDLGFSGPGPRLLPTNAVEVCTRVTDFVSKMTGRQAMYTIVNAEAARFNLPHFLSSLTRLEQKLADAPLVICTDDVACTLCRASGDTCILARWNVSQASLAPVQGAIGEDYWKVMYGRHFISNCFIAAGSSVLAVDVDSVFFQNPFFSGIAPDRLAVVRDSQVCDFGHSADCIFNMGLMYVPRGPLGLAMMKELWRNVCAVPPGTGFWLEGEQKFVSSVLREISRVENHSPVVLPDTYLNLCFLDCGFKNQFQRAQNIQDLLAIEEGGNNNPQNFSACTAASLRTWVFFHACCLAWPHGEASELARGKGASQRAFLHWIQLHRRAGEE